MNPCCANSHMFVPLRVLTVRASLHTHAHAHTYTYIISQIVWYMNPCCANSHMSVPLRVLTVRFFFVFFNTYIHKYTTNRSIDSSVYEPVLSKLTCVCVCVPLFGAHTKNLWPGPWVGTNFFIYLTTNVCVCVKFSLGHTIWFSPFFWISHWAFCPKWMAIRVCKRCRNRAAKLKWQ